ncbi:MAG: hypothetical protein P9M13_10420 [Candidatus Ancaeobacter aquaticus]|nr:hypothetical protein [Candidatus Ancaeobacter aquaticus]
MHEKKAENTTRKDNAKWYYSRAFVLVMLFFVLGIFALPLLWYSPRFSRFSKAVLTIVIVFLTLGAVWAIRAEVMLIQELIQQWNG